MSIRMSVHRYKNPHSPKIKCAFIKPNTMFLRSVHKLKKARAHPTLYSDGLYSYGSIRPAPIHPI